MTDVRTSPVPAPDPAPVGTRASTAPAWQTVRTAVLLAGLAGLLVLAGGAIGGSGGALIGFAIGAAMVGASYWWSDRIAIRAAGARALDAAEAPWLHATVAELSARAGLPMPRLYLSPAPQPNAFATGRNERHAAVAVTQGLLDRLPPEEVRAVLAHELGHIRNRDILLTSVAAAIATGISAIANMAMFSAFLGGGDDEEGPGLGGILLLALVAPVAATILQLALSRSRELEADRTGAELLGTGVSLASALQRIEVEAAHQPMDVEPAQASAYIHSPLAGRPGGLSRLFLTHPPTEERVRRLLAGQPTLHR